MKEKRPIVIQRNLAAWIALYRTLQTHRYCYWTLNGLADVISAWGDHRHSEHRILSPFRGCLHHSTTRYQVVFTDVSAVKASYVRLGTNRYPPHLPLIFLGHRARSRPLESAVIMPVVAASFGHRLTTRSFLAIRN